MNDPVKDLDEELVAENKADDILRGKPLAYSAALHQRYEKRLVSISKQMTAQTTRDIKKLFKRFDAGDHYAMDASLASQSRILLNALSNKFDEFFNFKSKAYAKAMAANASKTSHNVLNLSLKEISKGLYLDPKKITPASKEIIKASITQNVSLIRSIKSKYFEQIEGVIARSILGQTNMDDLITNLLKYENMTIRRAKLIALDQTKKVYVALNAERSVAVGLDEFEWLHSGRGKEPRHEHVMMDGETYSYKDLPVIDSKTGEVGLPGQLINCGCMARPILNFKKDKK